MTPFDELVIELQTHLDTFYEQKEIPSRRELLAFYQHARKFHSLPDVCCTHVGEALHNSIVVDLPGRPVAASCAISGCHYMRDDNKMLPEDPRLYDAAREACHHIGMAWTDPRTGELHLPPPPNLKD